MGLAERKTKQRIGYDPRNLTWSNDKDRFSFKHMSNLGWKENSGIGRDGTGMSSHIAVVRKADNGGIGMLRVRKEGQELGAGAGQAGAGLEDVLKRLASRSASSTPVPSTPVAVTAQPSPVATPSALPASTASSPGPSQLRNKVASRQRHLNAKRMASRDPAAMAAILGVPVSSLPASAVASPATSGTATPVPEANDESSSSGSGTSTPKDANERTALEQISTSQLSVFDYFRAKLRQKAEERAAARQAAGLAPVALAADSLANIGEEKKLQFEGTSWEGSKMKFEVEMEADPENDHHFAIGNLHEEEREGKVEKAEKSEKKKAKAATSDANGSEDAEAKKARKEAKKATKAAKAQASAESVTEAVEPVLSEKEQRRKERADKKAEKETKKAEKEAKKAEKEAKKAEKGAKKAEKEARKAEKAEKTEKKRKRSDDEEGQGEKKRKSKSK